MSEQKSQPQQAIMELSEALKEVRTHGNSQLKEVADIYIETLQRITPRLYDLAGHPLAEHFIQVAAGVGGLHRQGSSWPWLILRQSYGILVPAIMALELPGKPGSVPPLPIPPPDLEDN
jgi:hypothetical protein